MISRNAQAGSLESGDVLVRVSPVEEPGITINIESKVSPRFAQSMERSVRDLAANYNVTSGRFEIIDRGALDFVLRARVTTALKRAMEVPGNG